MTSLREYQIDTLDKLRSSLRAGKRRPVVQMPTGAGKTIMAAAIIKMARENGKRVLFTVPALSLIDQTVERFEGVGIYDIGVIQADHWKTDPSQPVQVASVQTLNRRKIPKVDLVIVDECFAAGTKIHTLNGDVNIEDIVPGDKIYCATGEGCVVSVSRKLGKTGTIRFTNGTTIQVTFDHPIFTENGWVCAGELEVGATLFGVQDVRSLWSEFSAKGKGQFVSGRSGMDRREVLYKILRKEAQESYAQSGNKKQIIKNIEGNRSSPERKARKWHGDDGTTSSNDVDFGNNCKVGICDSDENAAWLRNPDLLQSGHSDSRNENSNRIGWPKSFWETQSLGQQEGLVCESVRVESVSFEKSEGDRVVYNLHVAGHPSYFANGVLVHNCHIRFNMYDQWFKAPLWQKTPIIGLSATPWAKGMGLLWDDLIIGTTIDALIKSGHLCDYKVFAPSHPDLGGVKTKMGDYEVDGLAKEMSRKELVADIVSTWLERGENRQTLCFCVTTAHAKFVQKQFQDAGVKCDYQDAFTSREDRLDIAKRFENGDCQIVCNVGTLTTGVDWDVRCVILARPTKSEILYVQMIGRGLRTAPGKDHLVVLDHSDTTLRLGFVSDIHHDRLSVGQKDVLEKGVKEEPLPKECPQCHYLRPPKVAKCPSCGYQPVPMNQVDSVTGELLELNRGGQAVKPQVSAAEKELFYRELVTYGLLKQYKSGWAWWSYRAKFDEKPGNWFSTTAVDVIRPMTASWIKHRQIATAKARAKLNPYPAQART